MYGNDDEIYDKCKICTYVVFVNILNITYTHVF